MAKYDAIYQALRSGSKPPPEIWDEFTGHCTSEFISKLKRYGHKIDDFTIISDLVSDLMVKIMTNIKKGTFDPDRATFKNYVDGIILNMIKKYFEKQKKESEGLNKYKEHIEFTSLVSGEERSDEVEELLEFLKENLSIHEYTVVYYRVYKELSVEETAKRLGKTNQQISRTLSKVKTKIVTNK